MTLICYLTAGAVNLFWLILGTGSAPGADGDPHPDRAAGRDRCCCV